MFALSLYTSEKLTTLNTEWTYIDMEFFVAVQTLIEMRLFSPNFQSDLIFAHMTSASEFCQEHNLSLNA